MIRPIIALVLVALTQAAKAQPRVVTQLIASPTRPTVEQIEAVLSAGYLPDFVGRDQLPVDDNRPSTDFLQNNYAVWFEHLKESAPEFIVQMERAYPDGKFAFIGRDMAAIADLFESFYRRLGQNDRVVRIPMSRGTLENLSRSAALRYLQQFGISFAPRKRSSPVVFVDAISAGGGRQGRFLVDTIYTDYVRNGGSPKNLVRLVGFVGLLGATAQATKNPLIHAEAYFSRLERWFRGLSSESTINYAELPILTFEDRRTARYRGFNESGYEHWVGAWHGSYGPLQNVGGQLVATPGEVSSEIRRLAVLIYQAHIVRFGRSDELINRSREYADSINFEFPGLSELHPAHQALENELKGAARFRSAIQSIQQIESQYGKVALRPEVLRRTWIDLMKRLPEPSDEHEWRSLIQQLDLKDDAIRSEFVQLLQRSKERLNGGLLSEILDSGVRVDRPIAAKWADQYIHNGHIPPALQLLASHQIIPNDVWAAAVIRATRSWTRSRRFVDELTADSRFRKHNWFSPAVVEALLDLSTNGEKHKQLFQEGLRRLGTGIEAVGQLFALQFRLTAREKLEILVSSGVLPGVILIMIERLLDTKKIEDSDVLALIDSMANKFGDAEWQILRRSNIRQLLLRNRSVVLDGTTYRDLRLMYWVAFNDLDQGGRAYDRFQKLVGANGDWISQFMSTRRQLAGEYLISARELEYFDSLAFQHFLSNPDQRGTLTNETWQRLLKDTTLGQQKYIEQMAVFLGPASNFIATFRILGSRIRLSQDLFEVFTAFDPSIAEVEELRQIKPDEWNDEFVKSFAYHYVQLHMTAEELMTLLAALQKWRTSDGLIREIALLPQFSQNLQTTDDINQWLTYFERDLLDYADAYESALNWVVTPGEYNSLRRPPSRLITSRLKSTIKEWRTEKQRLGWKFRWREFYKLFPTAIDNGEVRPVGRPNPSRPKDACVEQLEKAG